MADHDAPKYTHRVGSPMFENSEIAVQIPETSVHLRPKSLFSFRRNECSDSAEIRT